MGQTHYQGPTVSCKIQSSRTAPSWCQVPSIALPPPSHQLCLHVICTDLVARRHFWFLAHYNSRFHVQSSGTESRHRRDSVVPLPTGRPMGSPPSAFVSLTTKTSCPGPVSTSGYARMTRFVTTSPSSSYRQPTECRCNTIEVRVVCFETVSESQQFDSTSAPELPNC